MLEKIALFPQLFRQGWRAGSSISYSVKAVENLVLCGLGGSAIAGEIVKCLTDPAGRRPMAVCRGWDLPGWAGRKTLCFVSSYSGNTYETLRCLKEARRRGCRIITLTAGGQLERMARRAGYPRFQLPAGLPPRAAVPFSVAALLAVVSRCRKLPVRTGDLAESEKMLYRLLKQYLSPDRSRNPARRLARRLPGRTPLILTVPELAGVARRWANQFNENSKITAFFSLFTELTHNEIVGLTDPSAKNKYLPIILRPSSVDRGMGVIIKAALGLLKRNFPDVPVISASGHSRLAQVLSLILLGDCVSVYLARERGIDPESIAAIDQLKKVLKEQLP